MKFLYHHVAFFYQFGIKPSLEVFIGHEAFQSPDPEELYAALEEGNLILLEGSELSLRHPKLAEWYFEQNIMYNRWKISVSDMIGRFFRGFTDHVQGEKLLHTLLEHPEFQEKMNLGYYQKPGSGHITGLTFQNLGTWMDDLIERYADPDPKTLFHAFNCYLKADEHLPPLVLLEEFQQKHQDRIKDPEFLDVMIQCSLMVNNFAKGRELIDLRRSSGVLSPALISLKAKILTAEGEMVKAFSLLIDQLSVGNTDPGLCDLLADLEKEILHWIRTLDPQSENIPNSVKLELATTFLREKRAMNLAKFWIQQMPENAQTLRLLGEWYSVSEKPDQEQAGICFRKALALLPESSEMHVAFLNWCRDRYAETGLIQYFSEANSFFQSIQNQANIPLILIQIMSDLLMVRWKLEGLEASFMEAIEKLNNILRKNPQHTGALLQMGRGLVSKYQHSLTDFDFHKAESFLRELLYRSDTKNDAFASMAELYQCKWAQDRNPTYLVTARAFLQEAIEANPWEKEPRILMLNLLELDQGQEIAANYAWDCFLHLPGEIEFLKYWWDSYQNQKPRSPFIELKKLLQMSLHPEDCFGTLRKFLWDEKRLCHLFLALCEDFYEQNPQEPTYFSEQARVVLDLKSHAMAENLCVKIQEFLGQYPLHPAATKLQNEITRLQLSLLEEERILNCFFLANLNGEGALTMNPTGDPLFPEQGNSEALSRPGQYYYARLSGGKNQIGTYFERNFHRDFY
ncbi:MAG: hypothetical protein H6581_29975 [Bacteroidia bacterium]|nr:hypothetical protein [Bacteroidia bacterium]